MDTAGFVESASLWVRSSSDASRCVAPAGTVTLDSLGDIAIPDPDSTLFLRSAVPLSAAELARHKFEERRRKSPDSRESFRVGYGRLARVGYSSRMVDALFSLSLLARGRVPGDLATAAALAYREQMEAAPGYQYYGRVMELGLWTVLQYWYFYSFNDWRSRFFGTNDHEGDWEAVTVFLGPDGSGGLRPEWIACSCHDYPGRDLRRHWDDPELETVGSHPVIYVGAGSHAGYYQAGDYLAEVELSILAPVSRLLRGLRKVWQENLHQYAPLELTSSSPSDPPASVLSVPFVDYARGDGYGIGPGEERAWSSPICVTTPPSWIRDFHGLWGYFARDPLTGEDAPPGPMWERDGRVRLSWQDPTAWCDLGSTPPGTSVPELVADVESDLLRRRQRREERLDRLRRALLELGIEASAVEHQDPRGEHVQSLRRRRERIHKRMDAELGAQARDDETLHRIQHPGAGSDSTHRMREHLRRPSQPLSDAALRGARLTEIWAALSVGLMLMVLVLLAVFWREQLVRGAVVMLSWFLIIEAILRRRLAGLITGITLTLAIVCTAILLIEFHRPLAIIVAAGMGIFLLWENLRELRP